MAVCPVNALTSVSAAAELVLSWDADNAELAARVREAPPPMPCAPPEWPPPQPSSSSTMGMAPAAADPMMGGMGGMGGPGRRGANLADEWDG